MTKSKDNEPVTFKMLQEAVDAILAAMDSMINEILQRFEGVDQKIDGVRNELRSEIRFVREDIDGLRSDVVEGHSPIEFEKLKTRVSKLEAS